MRRFGRESVRCQNNLVARIIYRVERVKEFLLRYLFCREELYIIDQKQVNRSVLAAKFLVALFADSRYKLVCKLFARCIKDFSLGVKLMKLISDCLKEMRLSQTASAIEKERIILSPGRFGNAESRRVCKIVISADNKIFERISRVQANYKTGFWEIIILHTKPLENVPDDMMRCNYS